MKGFSLSEQNAITLFSEGVLRSQPRTKVVILFIVVFLNLKYQNFQYWQ